MPERLAAARMIVVDDHPTTYEGISAGVANDELGRFRVVGTYRSIAAADPAVTGVVFDIGVLDLKDVGTLAEIRAMVARHPVLVCTAEESGAVHVALWTNGARAVVSKSVVGAPLVDMAWDALRDPSYVNPQLARDVLDQDTWTPSGRQREILDLAARGMRVALILERLGISRAEYEKEINAVRVACQTAGVGEAELAATVLGTVVPEAPPPRDPAREILGGRWPTDLQLKTLTLLADGYSLTDIAGEVHRSQYTVRNNLRNALEQAGLARQDEATQILFAYFVLNRCPDPEGLWERLRRRSRKGGP